MSTSKLADPGGGGGWNPLAVLARVGAVILNMVNRAAQQTLGRNNVFAQVLQTATNAVNATVFNSGGGQSSNSSAPQSQPSSPQPTSPRPSEEELREQAQRREEQRQRELQQQEIGRDVEQSESSSDIDLSGYYLEFFGDSLPSSRSALMNYAFALDDWDESGIKTIWTWRGEVLRRTGVVSIADGLSPLSAQWLMNNERLYGTPSGDWRTSSSVVIAQSLINWWEYNASTRYEIDLGDLHGLTASQVLDRYIGALDKRYEQAHDQIFLDELWRWGAFQNTFGAHPDLTTDVDDWLVYELGYSADNPNPAQSEGAVRAYLISQLNEFGIRLDREDRTQMGLEELTQLLYRRQRRRYIALTDQYEELTGFTEMSRLSAELLNPGAEGSFDQEEDWNERADWFMNATPEQQAAVHELIDELRDSIAGIERTDNLLRAYHMQYVPNMPDYSLLVLAATILFEPIDWIVTGIEIIQDASEGDLGGALLNAGLLIAPFAAGWMDDALGAGVRFVADEPPSGGSLRSGLSDFEEGPLYIRPDSEHMFGDRPGHIADTPENRSLLLDTAFNRDNRVGVDKWGNEWYSVIREDGTQVWAQVRNGKITNGGINDTPLPWNDVTGFSSP